MMQFAVRHWEGWSPSIEATGPQPVPAAFRRRVTALGRNALGIVSAVPGLDHARYVFSSRHGEFSRTLAILRAIAAGDLLSPTDFSMSVHHALIGLLSIAHGNHGGHIALAGGAESFCYGMVEAISCLNAHPEQPVVLFHADEPLPDAYAPFNPDGAEMAVTALLLEAAGEDMIRFEMDDAAVGAPADKGEPATHFMRFLATAEQEATYNGAGRRWRWVRHGDR